MEDTHCRIVVVAMLTVFCAGRAEPSGTIDKLTLHNNNNSGRSTPTPWRLVSAGCRVNVHPPTATCGYDPNTAYLLDSLPTWIVKTLLRDRGSGAEVAGDTAASPRCVTAAPCPARRRARSPGGGRGRAGRPGTRPVTAACRGPGNPCIVGLRSLGCPDRFTVTMSVKDAGTTRSNTSYSILLETQELQIAYRFNHTWERRWKRLKVKVDTTLQTASLYIDGKLSGFSTPQSNPRKRALRICSVYVGSRDATLKTDVANITVVSDVSQNRHHAFSHCACPLSHPVPDGTDTYRCHTHTIREDSSNASSVLRPSVGLLDHQVLVDPLVLVNNQLGPYFWVSAPGMESFSLTLDLGEMLKVERVRIVLLTPPPSGELIIQNEVEGRWERWYTFSKSCDIPALRHRCQLPPRSPVPSSISMPVWILDTDAYGTPFTVQHPTQHLRLKITGKPSSSPPLEQHIIAQIQAYTATNKHLQVTSRRPATKLINQDMSHKDKADVTFTMDMSDGSPQKGSELNSLHKIPHRVKRASGTPTITSIYPQYGPLLATAIRIEGTNFGPANVSVKVGNTDCLCHESIMAIEPYSNLANPGCNTDTQLTCLVTNSGEALGLPLDVTVSTTTGTGVILSQSFTFRPDPVLSRVQPRTQYISGGRRVTITGEHLDSGVEPGVFLTTWLDGRTRTYGNVKIFGHCTVQNSTTLECVTPRAIVPKSYQRRKKRSAEEIIYPGLYINDFDLTVDIGIKIGALQLQPTGDDWVMYVSRDPTFKDFPERIFRLRYYEATAPLMSIDGERLTHAAKKDDYTVTVGGVACNVTHLASNVVRCVPPTIAEIPDGASRDNDGNPIVSVSVANYGPYTPGSAKYEFTAPVDVQLILGTVLGIVSAILLFIVVVWCWHQQERKKRLERRLKELSEKYKTMVTEDKTMMDLIRKDLRKKVKMCTLAPKSVTTVREIGAGNFGKVYVGRLVKESSTHTEETPVAIKTVKDDGKTTLRQLEDFLEEATLMIDFDHKNVMTLIGVYVEDNRPFVVLPFMANGDLKKYVSNPSNKFKVFDLIVLLIQVADGMNYLSNKGAVHRDLRAVNCMVDGEHVVKVGDFGLARWTEEEYYVVNDKERPLPVKWMSPESLQGSKFSTFSDVWSFGIVMWEILTRGRKPFADVENYRMKEYVLRGGRMSKPDFCPDEVYRIMLTCWNRTPRERPEFSELSKQLSAFVETGGEAVPEVATEPVQTDDSDYHDVMHMRERTTTNEYIKKPGEIPEYLQVLSSTDIRVPSEEAPKAPTDVNPTEPPSSGEEGRHHYENEDYLQPSVRGAPVNLPEVREEDPEVTEPCDDEQEEKPASPSAGGLPYFVNPPISDDYINAEGHQKLAESAHVPRGDIYKKASPGSQSQPEGSHDVQVAGSQDNDEEVEDSDYINVVNPEEVHQGDSQSVPASPQVQDEDALLGVEIAVPEPKSPTVSSLAAMFGGAKTKDYENQPSHVKRNVNRL